MHTALNNAQSMMALPWLDKDAVRSVLFYVQYPADKCQHRQDSDHCNYTTPTHKHLYMN